MLDRLKLAHARRPTAGIIAVIQDVGLKVVNIIKRQDNFWLIVVKEGFIIASDGQKCVDVFSLFEWKELQISIRESLPARSRDNGTR